MIYLLTQEWFLGRMKRCSFQAVIFLTDNINHKSEIIIVTDIILERLLNIWTIQIKLMPDHITLDTPIWGIVERSALSVNNFLSFIEIEFGISICRDHYNNEMETVGDMVKYIKYRI